MLRLLPTPPQCVGLSLGRAAAMTTSGSGSGSGSGSRLVRLRSLGRAPHAPPAPASPRRRGSDRARPCPGARARARSHPPPSRKSCHRLQRDSEEPVAHSSSALVTIRAGDAAEGAVQRVAPVLERGALADDPAQSCWCSKLSSTLTLSAARVCFSNAPEAMTPGTPGRSRRAPA